jgi:gamma-glutamyl-gamma-aminobutyrate hydrolase PuuD
MGSNSLTIGNIWYAESFISNLFNEGKDTLLTSPNQIADVDLVVFWGGEDVNPKLYGEKNKHSHINPTSGRDRFEMLMWERAVRLQKPILGICRGAQFACVMSGGKLWQHVNNHSQDHQIIMANGEVVLVTSTHHQMMRPGKNTQTLGVSKEKLSLQKYNENGVFADNSPEVEIAYDPITNALMIQGHPEYPHATTSFKNLTKTLIQKHLGVFK